MEKFKEMLTETGSSLIQKRAENVTNLTKSEFEDIKRNIERQIMNLDNEIITMEDLSATSTQTLLVGENINPKSWAKRRYDIALELRDLKVELETINFLLKEYFE